MTNTNPVRQYIGARYVPLFADPAEWDNTKTYEPLTIVLHKGNSYTSRQYVPAGIDITNNDYWALTGNYNAQVEAYRAETQANTSKFAAMGINNTNEATEFLHRIETLDNDSTFNKEIIKAGFGADTIDAATTSYKSNYMDIRKLGCKPNDTTANNAQLINKWLSDNPQSALYVPNGEWFVENTITATLNDIFMDGTFHPIANGIYEDNYIVKLIGTNNNSNNSYEQAMNKHYRIKVNCDMTENNGILIRNYFETNFDLIVIKCHATGIQVNQHIMECYINGKIYGAYTANINSPDTDFAQKGLEVLNNSNNDNQANILARNVKLGIDLHASVWTFHYIHVWGCINVLKLYANTDTQITKFYTDYCIHDSIITNNDTNTLSLYINSVFGIMLDDAHLIDNSQYVLTIDHIYSYYYNNPNKTPYAAITNKIANRSINININKSQKYEIKLDDLNTLTANELIDKYGDIRYMQCIIPITFPKDPAFTNWTEWLTTPYAQNLKDLKYPLPPTLNEECFYFGKTYVTYKKQYSQSYKQTMPQLFFVGENIINIAAYSSVFTFKKTDISL